jgi:pentapeptide repeat protein
VLAMLAVVAVALAIAWALFVPTADWLATHDVGQVTGALRTMRLQTARDAARSRLLTLAAGLFAVAALVYTARNFTLSREGQVTDRYTKAIEQLGSDKLDVRIGGIYALERIARDSPKDHPTVIEVLAAFIREHSHEQWPVAEPGGETPERSTRPDVQAAITVIGRRDLQLRHDGQVIDLEQANLTRARLMYANLAGALLTDANLTRANLFRTNFTGAYLTGANLTNAVYLNGAILTHAHLDGAIQAGFAESTPDGWVRDPASGRLGQADDDASEAGN